MGLLYEKKNNRIWFLGRSYEEYLQMFDLNEDFLKDQRILDIAAGASSFTPRLSNKGYKIAAVDILYGFPAICIGKNSC